MFTGIIAAVGVIEKVELRDQGVRLTIDAGELDLADVAIGDSIAIDGVCLTAVALAGRRFEVDVSQETIECTAGFERERGAAAEVNLEKALRLADRLGGHLMSGHVDGVGEVLRFEPVGESQLLKVRAPLPLAKYIARKGSIGVQGVSLTVNRVDGADFAEFEINLIPHTLAMTTLKHLKQGARVNLEVDLMARYIERMIGADRATCNVKELRNV